MVKRPRIVSNPSKRELPPEADKWATQGGIDPELQQSPTTEQQEQKPAESATPVPLPESEPKGKPFPHRISFDTTTEQYKRLKRASFEEERSLNEIIREAVEDWLNLRGY